MLLGAEWGSRPVRGGVSPRLLSFSLQFFTFFQPILFFPFFWLPL